MSVTVPALHPHTQAVKAVLQGVGDLGVYSGAGPGSPHEHVPYVVLFPSMPSYDGPTADIHADVDYRALCKFIGGTQDQAEDAADRARAVMLDPAAALAPAGRVLRGPVRCEQVRQATRDDDPRLDHPLWQLDEVYVVPTTPA